MSPSNPGRGRRRGVTWCIPVFLLATCGYHCGAGPGDPADATGVLHFFAFSKAMVRDDLELQQRGHDAVRRVRESVEGTGRFVTRVIQEKVRDLEEYTRDPTPFLVTSEIIADELRGYARELTRHDTIVIYSHSHGLQTTGERGLGGLLLDDPGTERPVEPRWLDWSEYADLVLALPARNVVVLTMSCFSGGLIDHLDESPAARELWQDRESRGRNFVVISSQNATSLSSPRRIDGEVINPFTYALIKAFAGEADGFQGRADQAISLGELVGFTLEETSKHQSAHDPDNDPDPQVTGSYSPDWILVPDLR